MDGAYDIAEKLEEKRLIWLKLNLFGFAFGGLFRIIQYFISDPTVSFIMTTLQIVGSIIWALSLYQLVKIGRKINGDQALQQIFNDELVTLNRLKAMKVGFFAVLITQAILISIALFYSYDGLLAAELTIYVGVCAVLAAFIIYEELLAITLFSMDINEDEFKIWNWKTLTFFHWIINPGTAINELLLGQRIPKVMLIEKNSPRPMMERTYVPCPSCETLHNGSVWSTQNKTAFKNWYGLYCPNCGEIIPCLLNIFSRLLIAITYPLWFWKQEDWKKQWLAKQPARFENLKSTQIEHKKVNWLKMGLVFGGLMFLIMTVFFKGVFLFLTDVKEDYISYFFEDIAIHAVIWLIAGLVFGFLMKYILGKRGMEKVSSTDNPTA